MKPVDVNPYMYIEFSKWNSKKSLQFKGGYSVRISKYKNIFAIGYVPNWSEEAAMIRKVKRNY